ncbi:hypothetical protein ACIQB5_42530 [Streptomyces sp. NPDC088560]|uniref:hypothetical protein n=1 Tax=Streptomyces sp. NPDC088560 TaxID=3365868 RepID=UPI0037F44038
MRGLQSGMIQFGLVTLPVKLFSATEEHQVRLREIHAAERRQGSAPAVLRGRRSRNPL